HRQLLHEQKLARLARVRAGRAVEDEVERQVLLLEEELHEERIEAPEDVPVDVAQVIAHDVRPVVGELDALAPLLRAPLPLELAPEDLGAGDVKGIQARKQLRVEEILEGRWAGWGGCAEHWSRLSHT